VSDTTHRPIVVLGALLAAGVYFVALGLDDFAVRLLSKPWPLLALIGWVAANQRSDGKRAGYVRFVLWGLWACLLGDMLLEERDRLFLPGVAAFLIGHVCYVGAYLSVERRPRPLVALPFVLWSGGLYVHLLPGLGKMTIPLAAYALVLTVMMWRAAARLEGGARRVAWFAALGALSFGIGDTLIALDRFGESIPHVRFPIMILYWLGQLGIAASAALYPERDGS
jgi:uncharacterized membrane protein YhhN